MKLLFTIVYQAGIANVFKVEQSRPYNRTRLMQSDFRSCENFLRGIKAAGGHIRRAWVNEAGDIAARPWSVSHFDNAPFSDSFAKDLQADCY